MTAPDRTGRGANTAKGSTRWVALDGAYNFRDLGGYATATGEVVTPGIVYRSDALQHLTDADLRRLADLGVDRIIDLRSPKEILAVGRGALGDGRYEYRTASVIPEALGEAQGAPPGDDLAERYLWYLDVGQGALVEALELFAEPGRGAVVFHCAAGKDRTGVLAALLLSILEVSPDDIAADYALTTLALPRILERLDADPLHGVLATQVPDSRRRADSSTMSRFLRLLDDRYGGAQAWAEQAGVGPASIAALRAALRTAPAS